MITGPVAGALKARIETLEAELARSHCGRSPGGLRA
jgi:hypothetical protein